MKLIYKKGDVTKPEETGNLFIIHCVNDCEYGCMGSGVALALLRKWRNVKYLYHDWADGLPNKSYRNSGPFRLGEIQEIPVEDNISVINMVGQRDIVNFEDMPPIRYEAIKECLWKVRRLIEKYSNNGLVYNIVAPKFGSHLAGGNWNKIEQIILEVFQDTVIEFTIYSLE